MANKVLVAANATPIVWADIGGDYGDSPFAGTHQLTLTSLAAAAARQGAKADMDAGIVADRIARWWAFILRIEMDVASADNLTVDLYWAASPIVTAGSANPGGCSGADAAYTGTAAGTLAEGLLQLQRIGSLALQNDIATVVQQQTFVTKLPAQWGMPVVVNNSDQAFEGDDIEMSVTAIPLEDEIQ